MSAQSGAGAPARSCSRLTFAGTLDLEVAVVALIVEHRVVDQRGFGAFGGLDLARGAGLGGRDLHLFKAQRPEGRTHIGRTRCGLSGEFSPLAGEGSGLLGRGFLCAHLGLNLTPHALFFALFPLGLLVLDLAPQSADQSGTRTTGQWARARRPPRGQ